MKLRQYLSSLSLEDRQKFAERAGTTVTQLNLAASGKPISAERAMAIDIASNGAVPCEELRSDLSDRWAYMRGTQKAA